MNRRSSSTLSEPPSITPQKRGSTSSTPAFTIKMEPDLDELKDIKPLKKRKKVGRCTTYTCTGDIPKINGLFTRGVDCYGSTPYLYVFGGTQEDNVARNDFHRLNMKTRIWENLAGQFAECLEPVNPFKRRLLRRDLPSLDNPTSQIYRSHSSTFMLLFGGSDIRGISTSNVISINLELKQWEIVNASIVDPQATLSGLTPRTGAGSALCDDKLFVFGGWTRTDEKADGVAVDSFSVLDLLAMEWIVVDRPYPAHVGSLGYNLVTYAAPCFHGHKVVLTRGRIEDNTPMRLTTDDIFLFNTRTYKFKKSDIDGNFPPPLNWCDVCPHRDSPSVCIAYGSKYNENQEVECSSELWTYNVLMDHWECEYMEKDLWDLDADLQVLEHIPGIGWCLIGYKQNVGFVTSSTSATGKVKKERKPRKRKGGKSPAENLSGYNPTFNICVVLDIEGS